MIFLLWILFSFVLYAQSVLDVIEVTDQKKEFYQSSSSIQVDVDPNQGDVKRILEVETPFYVIQNGSDGGRISFYHRGSESRHLAFFIDGLLLNDSSNTDRHFDGAFYSLWGISTIDISQGPAPVRYGGEALSGAINFETRKGRDSNTLSKKIHSQTTFGSYAQRSQKLMSDWNSKSSSGTLSASYFKNEGFSSLNKKRFNATENDSLEVSRLQSSSRHYWKKGATDLLFGVQHGLADIDSYGLDSSDHQVNDLYYMQQKSFQENPYYSWQLRQALIDSNRQYFNKFIENDSYRSRTLENELLFIFPKVFTKPKLGFLIRHDQVNTSLVEKSIAARSLFLENTLRKEKLELSFGLRFESFDNLKEVTTSQYGLKYNLSNSNHLFFNQASGHKAPSIYQLYAPEIGNKNLAIEKSLVTEIGHNFQNKSWNNSLIYFEQDLNNLISFIANRYDQGGDFKVKGIELLNQHSQDNYVGKLSLSGFGFDSRPLRRPTHLIKYQGTFDLFNKFIPYFSYRKTGSIWDLNESGSKVKINSYELWDLGTRFNFNKFNLDLRFENILNKKYEAIYGYSTAGRSWILSANFTAF